MRYDMRLDGRDFGGVRWDGMTYVECDLMSWCCEME